MSFGVHFIFDAYGCDEASLNNKEELKGLLATLPSDLEMHTICDSVVVEVGPMNKKDPGGISGFVMIAESHIAFHTFPERGFLTLDIYTCQDTIDSEKVLSLTKHFKPTSYDSEVIVRGKNYTY